MRALFATCALLFTSWSARPEKLRQTREALALLRQELLLTLKRESLAFQLQSLAIPNFFEQVDDSFDLIVVHCFTRVAISESARPLAQLIRHSLAR